MVIVLWALLFNGYLYVHEKLRFNPTHDIQHDLSNKYKEIFLGIFILKSLILLRIAYLECTSLKNIWKLSIREQHMKSLNILVISFGFSGIIIGAFQPVPTYSSLLLIFEAGINLYVILLEIMYSPTSGSILEYENNKKIAYTLVMSHESEDHIELH